MQIKCDAGALAGAISVVTQVAGSGKSAPVLRAVKMVAADGKMTLSATDADHAARVEIEAHGEIEAFIEIDLIANKARALNHGQDVTIKMADDAVTVSQGRTRWKIPVMSGDGFPSDFVAPMNADPVEIAAADFIAALDIASRAAGASGAYATETGVLVDPSGAVVGASSTRMYVVEAAVQFGGDTVIPRAAIPALRAIFGKRDKVSVRCNSGGLSVDAGGVMYRTKLIDGAYPPWRRVIEKNTEGLDKMVTLDRVALVDALGRATMIREDKLRTGNALGVKMVFDGEECAIKAGNRTGEDGEDAAPASGDKGEIGVNALMLLDALATFSGDKVELRFKDEMSPIKMNEPGRGGDFRLVMPYRMM